MKPVNLQTNNRINPLGIDDPVPRLTWNCAGGIKQQAYRVSATDDTGEVLFDSGCVTSDSMNCRYGGKALQSGQRVYWHVILWDENGEEAAEEEAWFEMGLLNSEDRKAQWICGIGTDTKKRLPADCFRKAFSLKGSVVKARLYATACGVYSAVLNGRRLPGVLAPGTTEYIKRLYYQTYDVTELLEKENILDFAVGDGWFKGKLGFLNRECRFGRQLKLWAQLVLTYADGSREVIASDYSWRWCNDGPILRTDLKDGETYDARKVPSYSAKAQLTQHPVVPAASPSDGILEQEVFAPKLLTTPSGAKILDFGQNIAGYIRFTAHWKSGHTIRLRMFEALDEGEYSDMTLRKAPDKESEIKQEIVYTASGKAEVFQPEFFYSGFRYALVEGLEEVNPDDFEAVAVYSALRFTGRFHCSNEKINQFVQNTLWSLKDNFVDVPTDCPQREKSGWDGDAQVFIRTASYLADDAAFFRKWLRDVRDCQRADGRVANVSPSAHPNQDKEPLGGSVGWADAAVIIPYTLWKFYGDEAIIAENYTLMRGWMDYVIKAAQNKTLKRIAFFPPLNKLLRPYYVPKSPYEKYVIESGMHWGEWLEPDIDSTTQMMQPKPEIAAAYTRYSMRLLSEMLDVLGKTEEANTCRQFSEGARKAYNHYFVKDGRIQAPRQAPMVRALALGLLDEQTAHKVAADLNQSAIDRNYTVGTGFLSTPFVLGVLTQYGYVETAYKMMENTAAPGWLAMVEQGATTVWEVYHAYNEQGHPKCSSMNHYSPGAVCQLPFSYFT